MSNTPTYPPPLLQGRVVGARHTNPKLPIQPLHRPRPHQGSGKDRQRVNRACNACHAHKIKCSGEKPRCKHCQSNGRECSYPTSRKDNYKILSERCVQMAGYLKSLKNLASTEEAGRIAELLEQVENDLAGHPKMGTSPNTDVDVDGGDSQESPAFVGDSTVDPQYRLDIDSQVLVDENLHQTDRSRATGFVGQSSEVQWLRTLLLHGQSESAAMAGRRGSSATQNNSDQVSQVTFYLDAEDTDLDFDVDPYELPPAETAEHLWDAYVAKVHDSFPILSRRLFEDQFRRCFQGAGHGGFPHINRKWLAVLNLVFAIGTQYSHLTNANWAADNRDHLVYHARAKKCSWNNVTLSSHPDLPQIQVAGLLAFYYLSTGQVSRAWIVVGIALRLAQSLGLHVRNEDPSASASKREVLVRVWWCLYWLDCQLSIITGRPSVIAGSHCSVTLPLPLSEEHLNASMAGSPDLSQPSSSIAPSNLVYAAPQPMVGVERLSSPMLSRKPEANPESYFKAIVQVATITQSILTTLYPSASLERLLGDLQQDIRNLDQQLDDWLAALPEEFDFQSCVWHEQVPGSRQRMLLGFHFYEARILLTRPYLGRMKRLAGPEISPVSSSSLLRGAASMCVEAAKAVLDLLPDEPAPPLVYQYAAWWNCVHHLTQAAVALLLSLSSSLFSVQEMSSMTHHAKKATRWLRSMYDELSYRAYLVVLNAFESIAESLSIDITDLRVEHAAVTPRVKASTMEGTTSIGQTESSLVGREGILLQGPLDPSLDVPSVHSPVPVYDFWNPAPAPFPYSQQPDKEASQMYPAHHWGMQ